jgi:CheY-like chemotaxis protein
VVEATNADHAIAILEARRDIRVVFTDIRLPDENMARPKTNPPLPIALKPLPTKP